MTPKRSWRLWLAAVAALLVTGWLSVRAVGVARCNIAHEELAEPAGWRAWPVAPSLAGYTVVDLDPWQQSGLTSYRPLPMRDARLTGHGVCGERGASLKRWTDIGDHRRLPHEYAIRTEPAGDVLVVAGEFDRGMPEASGEERFVVAFRTVRDGPLGWFWRVLLPPVLGLAVCVLGVHALFSHRAKTTANRDTCGA